MLIVLEGLDGAGKSTQIDFLRRYLEEHGKKVKFQHFPIYETKVSGEMVARFLRGDFGDNDNVHPMLVALLFAENRRDAAPDIKQWLSEGYFVILDRYVYSNIAFQCAKMPLSGRKELKEWILDTEFNIFNIPRPDLNIFLDVPLGFVESKLKNVREGDDRNYLKGKRDIHEQSMTFQRNVRDIYIEQTELDSGFIRIDCSDGAGEILPPISISNKIQDVISFKI